ncbi:hypothetical protein [Kibdelosporangium philippinense]|uniref:hypothetical protein n=1 Tax=Kibdelosporangium philippinense TaxID=211113 RepID=UPI003605CD40
MDAAVTPARILAGEPENEGLDAADGGPSAGSFRPRGSGVVTAEEVTVPAQDSLGGDDQVELAQCGSGDVV